MKRCAWILGAGLLAGCPSAAKEAAADLALEAMEEAPPDAGTFGAKLSDPKRAMPSDPTLPMNVSKPDEARARIDVAGVRAALRVYQMTHDGQNPKSVSELDVRLSFPRDIVYDPRSGRAWSKTYPQY